MPGAIFLDAHASADFSDHNSFLYGHNVQQQGTMFAQLEKFKEESFYQEHPVLYLYTPHKNYRGEIIAMYSTSAADIIYQLDTDSDSGFQLYRSTIRQRMIPTFTLQDNSVILTLSTCSYEYDNARYVVHAVLTAM